MSTDVYLAFAPELTIPLTIYATSEEEARETYALWAAIHQPNWSREPARIGEVTEKWLNEQPQLVEAVERAKEVGMHDAVLLFRDHTAGWWAVDVSDQPLGSIQPVEPLVRSYEIISDVDGSCGREVMVFAFDDANAHQQYIDFRETFYGPVTHRYELREFPRWSLMGEQTVLRELMDVGVIGIAGRSPETGWGIFPPTHDLAGR